MAFTVPERLIDRPILFGFRPSSAPRGSMPGTSCCSRVTTWTEARRLLYIAMTRAREELCVSYYGDSPLMEELRERLR